MLSSRLPASRFALKAAAQWRTVAATFRLRNGWTATGSLCLEDYSDLEAILNDGKRDSVTLTGVSLERDGSTGHLPEMVIPIRHITIAHEL